MLNTHTLRRAKNKLSERVTSAGRIAIASQPSAAAIVEVM